MNTMLQNKDFIFEIKKKVEQKDSSLYSHYCIDNVIDENTISIVMTSSNRSKQTYFTLKTISNSEFKNIQLILVDDSDCDPISIDELKKFNFYIDFISINRENKKWHNPLVNYNIGFQFIKGSKIVIQNAEVCHVGDILHFLNETVDDKYYVFDVFASTDFDTNEIIYNSDINTTIFNKPFYSITYQSKHNNRNLHFLTALSRHTFNKIKHFSYDFTMGSWYDDDDFLLKIQSITSVVNIWHDEYNLGGIHLYHKLAPETWDKNVESNVDFFTLKKNIYNSTGKYFDLTENQNDFYEKLKKILI